MLAVTVELSLAALASGNASCDKWCSVVFRHVQCCVVGLSPAPVMRVTMSSLRASAHAWARTHGMNLGGGGRVGEGMQACRKACTTPKTPSSAARASRADGRQQADAHYRVNTGSGYLHHGLCVAGMYLIDASPTTLA